MGSEQNSNHSFNKDFDNGCQGYTGSTKEHRTWSGVGGGGKRRLPGGNGINERLEGVCQGLRGGT